MKQFFIDEEVRIHVGEEASKRLASCNDRTFLSKTDGIASVTRNRWQSAQRAEHKHWMKYGRSAVNDRNDIHRVGFCEYKSIRGRTFSNGIELGCGPFSNLRIIGRQCRVMECSLLDPLIQDYLTHPHCYYSSKRLYLDPMNPGAHLLNRLAPSLLHLAQQCTKSFIPIRRLYAEPIEEMPTQAKYDLLVMVNVLEHCYDAPQVFRNILEIITRGGILVFHDKLYQHDQVEQEVDSSFDAAHPLRVDRTLIHAFLQEHFSVLSTNIVHKVDRRTWIEEDHEGDDLYFIGTRRSGLESR